MNLDTARWIQEPGRPSILFPEMRVWHLIDHDKRWPTTKCSKQIQTRAGLRTWTKMRKSDPTVLKNTAFINERICQECHKLEYPGA
jgi:hypothetical protein